MKKLFIVDAYALIYRSYYAFMRNPQINTKGLNTSAVFGFYLAIEDLLKKEKPSHVIVAFDPGGKTFRSDLFPAYKAQRDKTPEDIITSVPLIQRFLQALNIQMVTVPHYEADDVVGTLSKQAEKEGFEVYMMTPDKDFAQLVSPHIYMYKPAKGGQTPEILGVEEVKKKYGLKDPLQVIDMLGLMGDAADNIPGCPKVGEKTAIKLLKEFESIENLLDHTEALKGALKRNVEENVEQIKLSKDLATIRLDAPITFSADDSLLGQPDVKALVDFYTEMEFRSALHGLQKGTAAAALLYNGTLQQETSQSSSVRFSLTDQVKPTTNEPSLFDEPREEEKSAAPSPRSTAAEDQAAPSELALDFEAGFLATSGGVLQTVESVEHTYVTSQSDDDICALVDHLKDKPELYFYLEQKIFPNGFPELVAMAFSTGEHQVNYLSFQGLKPEAIKAKMQLLKPLFEQKTSVKVSHDIKSALHTLRLYGVELEGDLFDEMVAHYLLQPDRKHDLGLVAESRLNYLVLDTSKLRAGTAITKFDVAQADRTLLKAYVAERVDMVRLLYANLKAGLVEHKLYSIFSTMEMPLLRVLFEMEHTGVPIDVPVLESSAEQMRLRMNSIEEKIRAIAEDPEFKVSSPKQIGVLLFEKLKLKTKPKKTKSGQYVTDEETLMSLKDVSPIVTEILEYRTLRKMLSTYIEALPKLINPTTGRVHTTYNQAVASTGRLSSSNPNLQNIPIRDESTKEIRQAFVPAKDQVFLSADYSQVELRLMAHLSQDPHLLAAFNEGLDVHSSTASKIFKVPLEEVTSTMRRQAKTANFGIIYGISAFGLAERLDISNQEAKALIDGYFANYPAVKAYMNSSIETARTKGYVETLFHRKRLLPDINSRNHNIKSYAERNAINAPIQGTAADIIKLAMISIAQKMKAQHLKSEMILQVHDELNFSVPVDEVDAMKKLVRQEMEHAVELSVPLEVEIGEGHNWLEAH